MKFPQLIKHRHMLVYKFDNTIIEVTDYRNVKRRTHMVYHMPILTGNENDEYPYTHSYQNPNTGCMLLGEPGEVL